ncbi:MAG TPA: hydrogenase nickel incorporation protein HypB [Bacillota bacterium]|nr:hydrogenase nickel incorporation protein HypB [Bacillota bacterium]
MEISIKTDVLKGNEDQAAANRAIFNKEGITALNIMGSPGAGKTTILERTIQLAKARLKLGVIEGDIFTTKDADRIEGQGVPVTQINTGGACHLDAVMVNKALKELPLAELELIIIENVGNLVCPVEFNLGEHLKVAILSVIEGDDKPLKYPLIFRESTVVLLNKMDLLPFCDVNLENMKQDIYSINPQIKLFEVSARTGEGMEQWVEWLCRLVR